jgi:hypothetical protein
MTFLGIYKMSQWASILAAYIFMQISIAVASDSILTQRSFKRMVFSANSWSNLVYKAIEVRNNVECASFCQVFLV